MQQSLPVSPNGAVIDTDWLFPGKALAFLSFLFFFLFKSPLSSNPRRDDVKCRWLWRYNHRCFDTLQGYLDIDSSLADDVAPRDKIMFYKIYIYIFIYKFTISFWKNFDEKNNVARSGFFSQNLQHDFPGTWRDFWINPRRGVAKLNYVYWRSGLCLRCTWCEHQEFFNVGAYLLWKGPEPGVQSVNWRCRRGGKFTAENKKLVLNQRPSCNDAQQLFQAD